MHDEVTARSLREIPSVEKVMRELGGCDLPRGAVIAVVRRELSAMRAEKSVPDFAAVVSRVHDAVDCLRLARIQPLINGTGIIIHTNFGRAPLGQAVVEALSCRRAQLQQHRIRPEYR